MRLRVPLLAVLLIPLAVPGVVRGQSLFGAGGLGIPLDPLDARARALGGTGLGLYGAHMVPTDPTGPVGMDIPVFEATIQPVSGTVERADGTTGDASGTRFPLLGITYPAASGVATVTYGGFLERRWQLTREGTEQLGDREVPVVDRFRSGGAAAALRVGWARTVTSSLALGGSVGLVTGELSHTFTRQFDTAAAAAPVDSFSVKGRWALSAPTVTLGARWDLLSALRLAGSLSWYGSLDAEPREPEDARGRSYSLPLELRVGASGRLTPRLVLSAGLYRADWSGTGADLQGSDGAGTAWTVGSGLEWTGARLLGRSGALRLGYHRATLPFELEGVTPSEWTVAGGFGLNLAQAEERVLARADLAVERGRRWTDSRTESFWRTTLTLRVTAR